MPYLPIELQQHINEYAKPVTHPGWRYGSYSGRAMRNAPELLITSWHTREILDTHPMGHYIYGEDYLYNTIPNILGGHVDSPDLSDLMDWCSDDDIREMNPIEFLPHISLILGEDIINDIDIYGTEQTPQYNVTNILYNLIMSTHIHT